MLASTAGFDGRLVVKVCHLFSPGFYALFLLWAGRFLSFFGSASGCGRGAIEI